jgi:uncharacterized protein YjbI with pentapeptide repeats
MRSIASTHKYPILNCLITNKMNCSLYLCGVLIQLAIVPAAHAYNQADMNNLLASNKCVGCDLSGADLSRKQLVNADLQAANLVGANLTGANLSGAKLGGVNLTGANLTSANFTQAVLQAANLIDVKFTSTNLTRTDLSYANLVNTTFKSAILVNTDLAGANLALADFTGANLSSTSLASANLTGAKGVSVAPARSFSAPTQESAPTVTPGRKNQQDLPDLEESSPVFRRPRVYRIPPGLGSPQRLIPGGTHQTPTTPLPANLF